MVWVKHLDSPTSECTAFVNEGVDAVSCDFLLPTLCELDPHVNPGFSLHHLEVKDGNRIFRFQKFKNNTRMGHCVTIVNHTRPGSQIFIYWALTLFGLGCSDSEGNDAAIKGKMAGWCQYDTCFTRIGLKKLNVATSGPVNWEVI